MLEIQETLPFSERSTGSRRLDIMVSPQPQMGGNHNRGHGALGLAPSEHSLVCSLSHKLVVSRVSEAKGTHKRKPLPELCTHQPC